jgi:gamma-glutamylcyclotransferase (GGCT)/AIG2-like uncharacterized protein YtfP
MVKKTKVAVYGSLRKGLHNHKYYLKNSKFIGQFQSNPDYTLFDLGSFPGIHENGNTSVTFELYEVDESTLAKLDNLEGVDTGFYHKSTIVTPYGDNAVIYIYSNKCDVKDIINHGDWKEHMQTKKFTKLC